jgi:hypothetical protein
MLPAKRLKCDPVHGQSLTSTLPLLVVTGSYAMVAMFS